MGTPMVATHTQARVHLSPLRAVIIGGLVGNVLVFTAMQLIMGVLIPPLAIILGLTLVIAGVCATRWRWAPLLVVLWCVLSIGPGIEPYVYDLTHPAQHLTFIATLSGLSLLLVSVVASLAELLQSRRPAIQTPAPRWLNGFLIGMATLVLGASLVALIPASNATAGVSAEALAQLPALVSGRNTFDQAELRARVGETVALRLENSDTQAHYFDIDAFNVHVPMPAGKSALALFKPTAPGTYTFYCHIPGHTEAGMAGTLIVEP